MENKEKVFVVGHKNPDTDSICSAISYAYLKNKIGEHKYIPKRVGEISEETQFVLDRFGFDEPEFLSEVGTQVKDMEMRRVAGVDANISLKRAWSLMRKLNITTIPIVENEMLIGLITTDDIAKSYMDFYDSEILSSANTQYNNIIETLEGDIIVGNGEKYFNKGKVLVAAANPDLMESYIKMGDLVILGNRYESQLCAIEMEASCIVVCEGAVISRTIKKIAEDHGCTIISSPHDTYTVARLINQSMPIEYFMETENLMTFKTDDFTNDIKDVMGKYRFRYFPVLDMDNNYVGMISRRNLLNVSRKKLILVDHNEKSQAVDEVEAADVLEIIDHHRLNAIETINPVYFRNQPLGCTATIIYQIYCEKDIAIPKDIAGLLCSAIISDTLLYSSPTCTVIDKNAAEELAIIAGIDIKEYAREMFKAGSNLKEKTAEEIFYQDYKTFNINNINLKIGQINTINDGEVKEIKNRIIEYMNNLQDDNEDELTFFMLTSIIEKSTTLIYSGKRAKEIVHEAFGVKGDNNSVYLKGIMSRKKQFVPSIMVAIQN